MRTVVVGSSPKLVPRNRTIGVLGAAIIAAPQKQSGHHFDFPIRHFDLPCATILALSFRLLFFVMICIRYVGAIVAFEDSLKSWAKSPGQTEQEKCDRAVTAVRKAKDASEALSKHNIRVFAQGSYCNRTNVREDSDVDVCLLCTDSLISDFPEGMMASNFGLSSPADYSYDQFKSDVQKALNDYFGAEHVTRGNKAFDIKENTYRIAADVVPCFEHRRYKEDGTWVKPEGTAFYSDGYDKIINWPDQNYANGVAKNTATVQRFKDVVRIFKRVCNKMKDENNAAAAPMSSFLLESLVWNVPNDMFVESYITTVRSALIHLYNNTAKYENCSEWGEVNELKYLFRGSHPWTYQQVNTFLAAMWAFLELK